jgi:hypothetical protein
VVQQSNLHQVLGQGPGLNVVVVCLGDFSDPAVRRAVGRDVKVQGLSYRAVDALAYVSLSCKVADLRIATCLQNDSLSLQNLVLVVSTLGHVNKLLDTTASHQIKSAFAPDVSQPRLEIHLGARISSYLAAMNMAVTPTNWSLINETTLADKNLSTMLTAIQSVSGNM